MVTNKTQYSDRVYLQRLLVEGVREGEYVMETPDIQQYRQNDDDGHIGNSSDTLQFCTPEGVVIPMDWDVSEYGPEDIYFRYTVEEIEFLRTLPFAKN